MRRPPYSLRPGIVGRLVVLHLLVLVSLTLLLGGIEVLFLQRSVRDELGQRALGTSRLVASMTEVVQAATRGQPDPAFNRTINRLRQNVGADYIVVGNVQGVRLAHPNAQAIGRPMEGGDNAGPLAGREIVSTARGSLGLAVRGKVPVRAANGRVVGVVSTGYLMPRIDRLAAQVARAVLPWFLLALLLGTVGAVVIARRLKREILNLEPEQIAALVQQHEGVLSALREAVIAVDRRGQLTLGNPRALAALDLSESQVPMPLAISWPELHAALGALPPGSAPVRDLDVRLRGAPVLVNVERLAGGGLVASFRDRAELMRLAEELTHVRGFVDVLRAQTHEHQNRLHTLSGLLQLGRPQDALQLIRQEVQRDADLRGLLRDVAVPRLAALLIGKRERAAELGLGFHLEPGANLGAHWDSSSETLVTGAGNLIENAFEALRGQGQGTVTVSIGEDPEGVQLEVMDDGPGVPPELTQRILERGFSTRGEGRGYGLALVLARVQASGGQLRHFRRGQQTVFQLSLPLQERR
ncbi:sensor histidine kinase [Deinococcus sonorensis]|uniref:histidine kinase n=2 Tax=Deinococcus sonorensis TaxID=309891 RepID=A0AAU7UBK8_9DEIO